MSLSRSRHSSAVDRVSNWVAHGLILLALKLPYEIRVRSFGWLTSRIVAPIAGYSKRSSQNLRLVMPELTEDEVRSISRRVGDNMGRVLIETYSHDDLSRICSGVQPSGSGWEALEAGRRAGKPAILVSGHFGNYNAVRVALEKYGYSIGAIYRPFNNRFFDAHYRAVLDDFGPTFARGSNGTREMVRHLRSGGHISMLADQHFSSGAKLTFFGRPAKTATSAAQLALKYDAMLVPVFGVRQPDGVHFDVVIEPPVPAGTPESMSQAVNDSLEAMIRKYPNQWLWAHRRWK